MVARIVVIHGRGDRVRELARAAAEVMAGWGVVCELRATGEVESLHDFDSAVLCDPLSEEMVECIERHRRDLAHMSVAYLATDGALKPVLNRFNEIRPVRIGVFGDRGDADEVREWVQELRANFVGEDLGSPAGIRPFLEAHPLERGDTSHLGTVPMSPAEERISLGEPPGGRHN